MIADLARRAADLDATLGVAASALDDLRRERAGLTTATAAPGLWEDRERARGMLTRLARVDERIGRYTELRRRLDDVTALLELVAAERVDDGPAGRVDDEAAALVADLAADLAALAGPVHDLAILSLLTDPDDERHALVEIEAVDLEPDGLDLVDPVGTLLAMYLDWAAWRGHPTEVHRRRFRGWSGLRSAVLTVAAPYAYGRLAAETGTHRLTATYSPDGLPRTAAAVVRVLPVAVPGDHVDVRDREVRVDQPRVTGADCSGRYRDTMVILTHLPTGIRASSQHPGPGWTVARSAWRELRTRLLAAGRGTDDRPSGEVRAYGEPPGAEALERLLREAVRRRVTG
ncbi:PCRF domain-containing protein [Polymorphospora sp. NPDC050346]|uniref:PCRF domain-containing protein n=1 Tax=Polymorphospora sp. NPDC050346 TaxID=3155780 RepID=UPI0033DC6DF1